MEHKIIGSIGMGILFVGAIVGGTFFGKWFAHSVPVIKEFSKARLMLVLLVYASIWMTAIMAQYYGGNFITDGKTTIKDVLVSDAPIYAFSLSGCIAFYLSRKQNTMTVTNEKAGHVS